MTENIVEQDRGETVLTPEQVAQYLRQHPDFFVHRDDLLLKLTIPHQRGDSISLVERQVALLRERSLTYRRQLTRLVQHAKVNEKLFERIRLLMLSLLECNDLEQLVDVIHDSLYHEFGIEFHSLILFSTMPHNLPIRIEQTETVIAALGKAITQHKAVCGQVGRRELEFLFAEQADNIGSVAIIPLDYALNEPKQLGVLALGSSDKGHFKASMGSLFITNLGDVLSRIMARHLYP